MTAHRLLAPLALALFTSTSLAQTPDAPAPDPLCNGILSAVKAAEDERPFLSLVPAGQSLATLPKLNRNPEGFADFATCLLYRAGNAKDGVNGGGPYNYVRCSAYSKMTSGDQQAEATAAQTEATGVYEKLAARASACLTPQGWTSSGGERTKKYQDHETILSFAKVGSPNHVTVEFLEDAPNAGSRSKTTTRSVYLFVRNPNPLHPRSE